ncbi:MAG: hypothetical protein JKY96_05515 [Phycisphaerales bacterium]|nr:hypothetical protein [Phycisphaerales bacterium]
MTTQSVRVQLGECGYDIEVGKGILGSIGTRIGEVLDRRASRAFVVVDTGVPS